MKAKPSTSLLYCEVSLDNSHSDCAETLVENQIRVASIQAPALLLGIKLYELEPPSHQVNAYPSMCMLLSQDSTGRLGWGCVVFRCWMMVEGGS